MRILFLDQSGKPGGAELCLIDIAKPYRKTSLVGLFANGDFKDLLEQQQIPVQVLTEKSIKVKKESGLIPALTSLGTITPLIAQVIQQAKNFDIIYANTQKALVVGAIASVLTRCPLVYHLHDILSLEHFSPTNLRVAITLANRCASLVIANSQASQAAFVAAGGKSEIVKVVYNGFHPENYHTAIEDIARLKQQLGIEGKFVIGHFSRLSPWKGQHILINALAQCPPEVIAIFVGDALFGEKNYVQELHTQVSAQGLENRVKFLGFRADIPQLMAACDLIAHTSTAPEPFGRVIVEGMLCGKPVIASQAGGAIELIAHNINGFLVPPNHPQKLAEIINTCIQHPQTITNLGKQAQLTASQKFNLTTINQQIAQLLKSI
ncbi:glycosyl transferase group 1 [Richelia sinica FACHB-800]|uniref:Glycosyl transferase group 1 n=1 Tax=Richelia sinica FACHB-800 TaxID=1357546 RepID=A0A975Y4V5_9NOST|nr:glycosyltransferase family 4 protein [Richelia sinica]MBD2665766.1 glycosyltransferase family 4 protein [Richelia sinica FACHB-800]QXE23579.1 glycosyl transferase group 1 [Richelia sinica FACHB-800]